jgi:NADPH:quinone reductase-like Zn-dependent oxidoreductase
MKAIVLRETGDPSLLRLEDVPDPVPGPAEVVVRLRAAALNRRDVWIRRGQYAGIRFPIILGSDGAGQIEAVGEGVAGLVPGTPVLIYPSLEWGESEEHQGPAFRILGLPENGTYAERVRVPAANVFPIPAHLSWEEAAALPLAGLTAYRALVPRGNVKAGERVLVTGIGGGVATLALIVARCLGARVFVTSGSDEKLRRAAELGAEAGMSYQDNHWPDQLRAIVGGDGIDLAIDGTGGENLNAVLDVLRPGGRVVNYGATAGPTPRFEVRRVFWKQLTVSGTTMGSPSDFASMLSLFETASLVPIIDRVFPLAEAAAAHTRMEEGAQFGKIVLVLTVE